MKRTTQRSRQPGARTERGLPPLIALALIATVACKNGDAAPRQPAATTLVTGQDDPLALTEQALSKNPIKTAAASAARLSSDLDAVGSVAGSEDHLAVVGPLVGGRIARLDAGVGDIVRKGQVLAIVESAEVGEAQAFYLTARAQLNAAEANLRRESDLVKQRISSAREYETAVANAVTERARLQAAEQRLEAIGFDARDIRALEKQGYRGGQVPIRASIGGTIIGRMVTLGQAVEKATDAFKIANLQKLWVLLDVYERDLGKVHKGQDVQLRTEAYPGEVFKAKVTYVENVIDEETRTANVRIEVDNSAAKLRIGQLVTARILGNAKLATQEVLAIPRAAVQSVDGKPLVFVKDPETGRFRRRLIEIGSSGGELVEVVRGVRPGELVATEGAFLLKSELLR